MQPLGFSSSFVLVYLETIYRCSTSDGEDRSLGIGPGQHWPRICDI